MEDQGWDTLEESWRLITQVMAQIEAPIQPDFRLRLLFFLYCHATEMDDLYHLVGNLLRVVLGDRYSMSPFMRTSGEKAATKPVEKVDRIEKWSDEAKLPDVAGLLRYVLVSPVRNAFFHSDYVLFKDTFRIKRGQGVKVDGTVMKEISFDWLLPRVELGINTVLELVDLLREHIASYQEPKRLRGRFAADGGWADLELIVQEGYGVVGFRSV